MLLRIACVAWTYICKAIKAAVGLAWGVTCKLVPARRLAAEGAGTVFVTDNALTMLMCGPRSVYSWDLVISKEDGKIWIDRRDQEGVPRFAHHTPAVAVPVLFLEPGSVCVCGPICRLVPMLSWRVLRGRDSIAAPDIHSDIRR